MMERYYHVGGHCWGVEGLELPSLMDGLSGFAPFECRLEAEVAPKFMFKLIADDEKWQEDKWEKQLYPFDYEDEAVDGMFGTTAKGYMMTLKPKGEPAIRLWTSKQANDSTVWLQGNCSPNLLRFALWMGYGLRTVRQQTVAIHSSCIVYREQAVLFLGESGTGKSTHTRLWREHIPHCHLLNDDSPIVRCEDGQVWVYGSPWSGKTPCYRPERFPLAGCVRLRQAPANNIRRLSTLPAFAALHPSAPPAFAYDEPLYDGVCELLQAVLIQAPVYQLACLPNAAAAALSCRTLFEL